MGVLDDSWLAGKDGAVGWPAPARRRYSRAAASLQRHIKISLCGGGMPEKLEFRHSSSPKRPEIKASSAAMTASASLPQASTVMSVPGAAPSVIRPRIDLPPTLSPQR